MGKSRGGERHRLDGRREDDGGNNKLGGGAILLSHSITLRLLSRCVSCLNIGSIDLFPPKLNTDLSNDYSSHWDVMMNDGSWGFSHFMPSWLGFVRKAL
jgi:hypothetical protein